MSRYADVEKMPSGPSWDALNDKEKTTVLSFLIQLPTADVEEVRHGAWMPIQGEYHWAETGVISPVILGYKCSICGDEEKYKYKYCHCGAKMDKEQEEWKV